MKTQILKILFIALTFSLGFTACNNTTELVDDAFLLSETPTMDDEDFQTEEEYPSKLIATIQKDGHEIKFYTTGSPDANPGIFMEESLYGDALRQDEKYLLAEEAGGNPFDVFMALTDSKVSVPKEIANAAENELLQLSGRKVMETGNSLELLDANFTEVDETGDLRGCYNDIGHGNFYNWYCKGSHWWNINHCGATERTSKSTSYSYFQGKWQYHQNTRVRVNNYCNDVSLYYYSYTSNGWRLDRSKKLYKNRNNYHSHWISNRAALRLIILPAPGAKYRSLVNFVK